MSGLAAAGVMLRLFGIRSAALKLVKSLPWQAWAGLAAGAALLLAWHVHAGWEGRQFNAAFDAGYQIEWRRHQADIAAWHQASAEAQTRNFAEVKRIAATAAAVSETANAQIEDDAARYRELAAAYARLHTAPTAAGTDAAQGGARASGLPGAAGAPGQPDAAAAAAFVPADDLQRCATLYAVAKGWQDWWAAEKVKWPG